MSVFAKFVSVFTPTRRHFRYRHLGTLVHEWNLPTNAILHIYIADSPVQWYKRFVRSIKRGISAFYAAPDKSVRNYTDLPYGSQAVTLYKNS